MRTRIVVHVDRTRVGDEMDVKRELEGLGVEVEKSDRGTGVIVGHVDEGSLKKVEELHGVRTMYSDPTARSFGTVSGGLPAGDLTS